MACTQQFWVENPIELFCVFDLIPVKDMTLEQQMNALTRTVFLLFLLLFLVDYRHDFLFLGVSVGIIIIIYYVIAQLRYRPPSKEHYGPVSAVTTDPFPTVPWYTDTNDFLFAQGNTSRTGCHQCSTSLKTTPDTSPSPRGNGPPRRYLALSARNSNPNMMNTSDTLHYCTPQVPIMEEVSINQRLVGPPNPKTLVTPILPNPAYDFQTWAPNDFVIPSFLNDERRQELYQNGYVSSLPCSTGTQAVEPSSYEIPISTPTPSPPSSYEPYSYLPYNYPSIDTTCGYNPSNLDYHLPINTPNQPCDRTPEMREYNRNLYTIPIQPGLATTSQVNQPYASMSNMGISMATPFLPTAFVPSSPGQGLYVESASATPPQMTPLPPEYPLRNEVYDPRLTGYGPNYRQYIDPMTGQPRYYYDDITSQTQSNYITRNQIDFTGFGPQIGPLLPLTPSMPGPFATSSSYATLGSQDSVHNIPADTMRSLANQTFLDSTLQQRTELQQRLMHKNSNREWQLRKAPINRMNQTRGGGGKSNVGGGYAGPRG